MPGDSNERFDVVGSVPPWSWVPAKDRQAGHRIKIRPMSSLLANSSFLWRQKMQKVVTERIKQIPVLIQMKFMSMLRSP